MHSQNAVTGKKGNQKKNLYTKTRKISNVPLTERQSRKK